MTKKIFTALIGTFLSAGIAVAEPLERYFSSANACYGRSYSAEHLNQHPDQQVLEIAVSHFPERQGLLGMESPFQPYPDTPKLVLQVHVWMRGQDRDWQDNAVCTPDGDRFQCAIECDGGVFYLNERSGDRLLLTLKGDLRFTQCDAGSAVLRKTAEDSAFLLSPVPRSHCRAN